MKKALIITKQRDPLLDKALFEVVGFQVDEVVFAEVNDAVHGKIARGNYSVVIPVGEDALSLFDMTGIKSKAGTLVESNGLKLVPSLSPGYISHNPHIYMKFAQDLDFARNTMLGLESLKKENQMVIIDNAIQLMDLIRYIQQIGYVSFDFETTKITKMGAYDPGFYTTCVSFTFQQGSSYVIPLFHTDSQNHKDFIQTCVKELEKSVFNNPDVTKIGHNVKFDMHCAYWLGVRKFSGPYHDTMVMHHLIDEISPQGLKDLVARYYSRFANYDEELSGHAWDAVPLDILSKYNSLDSDLTFRLYWFFTEILMDDLRLYRLFRNLSAPATIALFKAEVRGMLVDKQYIMEAINKADTMIKDQMKKLLSYEQVEKFVFNKREELTEEYLEKLEEKIVTAKEKAKEQKDKKIETLNKRIEKERNKEYKTEKAVENSELRVEAMLEELEALKTEDLNSSQLKRYQDEYDVYQTKTVDYEINFDSPAQMHDLLYTPEGFHFDYPKNQWGETLTGTGADVIDLIKDRSGFLKNLLIYRQMTKIYRTYLVAIRDLMDDRHRVHGTFKQIGTKTGRLSSANPNMQNIVTRTKYEQVEELVGFVKRAFGVPKGGYIMQADLSQAELRIIAHYAQERQMLKAYKEGIDLHELTAANVRGMKVEEFQKLDPKEYKRYRYEAKSVNFGFIYGMSAEGYKDYARTNYGLTVSLAQSKKIRDKFFETYPALLSYHKTYIAKCRKYKYVRTFFGRRVNLPEIDSVNQTKRGHAERNAINSPIQGTAGEYTVFALVLVDIRAPWLEIVNSVHDSIISYVEKDQIEEAQRIIKRATENPPLDLYFRKSIDSVDMKVDFEMSDTSWGTLKEV